LIGGIITLISGAISINSWYVLYSTTGTAAFTYQFLFWFTFTAEEALVFFAIGIICGVSIIGGAVLQYSGDRSKAKRGSILILIATILGIPGTVFGMFVGGVLSLAGAYLGLVWKPIP
jgi:hypothetical protein